MEQPLYCRLMVLARQLPGLVKLPSLGISIVLGDFQDGGQVLKKIWCCTDRLVRRRGAHSLVAG